LLVKGSTNQVMMMNTITPHFIKTAPAQLKSTMVSGSNRMLTRDDREDSSSIMIDSVDGGVGGSTITSSQSYIYQDSRNDNFTSKIQHEMRRLTHADDRVHHNIVTPTELSLRSGSGHHVMISSTTSNSSIQSQRAAEETIERLQNEVDIERQRDADYNRVMQHNKELQQQLSSKDNEIAKLKRQLQSANHTIESTKTSITQTYTRDVSNIEQEYNAALKEVVDDNKRLQEELLSSQRVIHELHDQTEELHKLQSVNANFKEVLKIAEKDVALASEDVELSQKNLDEIQSQNEHILTENMRMQTQYADIKENYKHLMEHKVQFEQENDVLSNELEAVVEECKVMRSKLKLLDEVTNALEDTVIEKDNIILKYKRLQESHASLEMDVRSMKNDLRNTLKENDRICVHYDELERKHARLQGTNKSDHYMTTLIEQQRDKMGAMVERYMNENTNILRERNELKEELICALENIACVDSVEY